MSNNKKNPSKDITDSVVEEVLLDKPPTKKNKKDKTTTSSPIESGSDSQGSSSKSSSSPPRSQAFVRHDAKGKIVLDARTVSEENKQLTNEKKVLTDEVVSLRARVEELSLRGPGSHPVPPPSKHLLISEGLERAQSDNSMEALFEFMANRMCSAVSTGKVVLPIPSLPLETSGPSKKVSPQDVESIRSSVRSSTRDILGSSMGEASVDELDISLEDNEG